MGRIPTWALRRDTGVGDTTEERIGRWGHHFQMIQSLKLAKVECACELGCPLFNKQLDESWHANARLWTEFVRHPDTISRRSITYQAAVGAVLRHRPKQVLDLGCGEGWLCRELSGQGVQCIGIDASESLIEAARQLGHSRYEVMTFAEFERNAHGLGARPDVVVANFSLLDEAAVEVLASVAAIAHAETRMVIQAAHPSIAGREAKPGWRLELFDGHRGSPWLPMPWYFRTLSAWVSTLTPNWRLERLDEPSEEGASGPSSLLLTASKA